MSAAPRKRVVLHTCTGNCWARRVIYGCRECGTANACDVCHRHDQPRGECSKCDSCDACAPSRPKAPTTGEAPDDR